MKPTKEETVKLEKSAEEINNGHIEIAKSIMKIIMYDNGMVDRWHPEKYPRKHVTDIAKHAAVFFDAYPELLTEEHLENICAGEYEENQELYGIYPEYKGLDDALNRYFN